MREDTEEVANSRAIELFEKSWQVIGVETKGVHGNLPCCIELRTQGGCKCRKGTIQGIGIARATKGLPHPGTT